MKKFTAVLMMVMLCTSCAGAYTITGDTYILESDSDFRTVMSDTAITTAGKYFVLACDIQLAGYSDWPGIGTKDNPFNGHFDGNGHTVYVNIWPLSGSAATYTPILTDRALFGYINTPSGYAVKNLKVEGSVRGYNAGGIVSVLEAGTLENCSFSGDVIAQTRAGDGLIDYLIAELDDDDVQGVDDVERFDDAETNKVEHRRKINAGGIVSVMEDGTITNCTSRGNVTAASNLTPANAGGIVGKMFDGNITGCYVEGDTVITASTAETSDNVLANAGGIAGYSVTPLASVIENCRFDGIVNSTYYAGGIAGETRGTVLSGDVISTTARITATYSAGGIAGYMASGGWAAYNYVYSGAAVNAESYSAGGIIGLLETSGRAVENNTSYASIGGTAQYLGGIVGALGNNTYSGVAIGENNTYTGADYGIGRDEWGVPSDGESSAYYITSTTFSAVSGEEFAALMSLNKTPDANVTWSYANLPDGMTAGTNGALSWNPSAEGSYTFKAGAYISGYGSTASADIVITVSSLAIPEGEALPRAKIGQWYSTTLTAESDDVYISSWTLINGSLPPGLQLNTSNGSISGTPAQDGVYNFTIREAGGNYAAARAFTLIVDPVLEILTDSQLPSGKAGVYYSCELSADTEYLVLWTLTDGALPDGVSLSSGMLSGTPESAGTYTFTLNAETGGLSADKTFTLEITGALTIITPSVLPAAKLGAYYSYTLSSDAPEGSEVLWAQILSSMYDISNDTSVYNPHYNFPEGMYLEETTGRIYGTPTLEEGVYRIRIRAVMGDYSATKDFTLTVRPTLSITTDRVLPHALTNELYTVELQTDASGDQAVAWSLVGSSLPDSLILDTETGIISGYPLKEGTYTFTVQAMMNGLTVQKEFELTAGETMIILTPEIPDVIETGENFSITLQTDNDDEDAESLWSVVYGILPPGLELNAETGEISGTPSRAGTYTFTVQNVSGYSVAQKELTLTVDFVISSDVYIEFQAGEFCSYKFSAQGVSAGAVSWTTSGDVLPMGLSLSTEGLLSGTTDETGIYTFSVYAFVSNDVSAVKSVRLVVSTNAQIAILTTRLPDGEVSRDYYAELDAEIDGAAWSMDEGSLPAGITLNTNGIISGVPEEPGTFRFSVRAESGGRVGVKELVIIITSPPRESSNNFSETSSGGGGCNVSTGRIMLILIVPFMRRRKH